MNNIHVLSEHEKHMLLVEWNNTKTEYPHNLCFHQLFEAQVERTPHAVALAFGDNTLTYQQLNRMSNKLAHHLQALGVGPDVLVGICVERSLEMVVGLLGVLKAGGAYVPLDPTYPPERLAFMLEDTQAPVILTQERLKSVFPNSAAKLILLDTAQGIFAQEQEDDIVSGVQSTNLCYLIYTSGSTGKPKGVMITHQGLVNYLSWCTQEYTVAEGQGTLVHSPLGFDLTVTSLLSPLIVGQKAILLPEGVGVEELHAALHKGNDFSLVKITPAHLKLLSQVLSPEDASHARALIIGGEALRGEDVAFWQTHAPKTRLINEYGPTETVVGCSIYKVPTGTPLSGPISIGRPIANTQLYILDEHLQPVPIDVAGELYIGGDGVARGYLNRPELTAERFISNPWSTEPNAHLYKTGDLARYRADGNIEFLGRLDDQVKIRGFRIELGEIESLLEQHPAVHKAVVSTREDTSGEKQLVAYVILHEKNSTSDSELQHYAMKRVPNYMVPAAVVMLDAFPLTPNGKVDRRKLSELAYTQNTTDEYKDAPRTSLEETVARIWSQALGIKHVGIHDDFFTLGGHSLLAMQVISKLRTTLHIELPLLAFFEADTVAQQAEYISKLQATEKTPSLLPSIRAVSRESFRKSASPLQRTLSEKKAIK